MTSPTIRPPTGPSRSPPRVVVAVGGGEGVRVRCIAERLNDLGELAHQQHDLQHAASLYRDSIACAREIGAKRGVLSCVDDAAHLACELERVTEAVRLLSMSTTMRDQSQMPRIVASQARYESRVALVRASLGEATFAAEWEIGRTMTLDEAEALIAEMAGEGNTSLTGPV